MHGTRESATRMDENDQQVAESTPTEQRAFDELAALCASPGYVHAIAAICLRENIVSYVEKMSVSDLQISRANERVLRNEITTLVGLMIKREIDWSTPDETT